MDSPTGYYFPECYLKPAIGPQWSHLYPNSPPPATHYVAESPFFSCSTLASFFSLQRSVVKRKKTYLLPELGNFQFSCEFQTEKYLLAAEKSSIFVLREIKQFPPLYQVKYIVVQKAPEKCCVGHLLKAVCLLRTMTATLYGRQQSRVVSVNKYKHSCSAEMASPWFNYRSCQSRWKNTAPDKARPHSLISHRPFSHPEMHRHPSANSQIKPGDAGILLPQTPR